MNMVNFAIIGLDIEHRRAASALTPALLLSLTVHAAAGALLFQAWPRAQIEPPQPLAVTIVEIVPLSTPVVEVPPAPPQTHRHERHVPQHAMQPSQTVQYAAAADAMVVERAVAAPVVTAPVVETPAAVTRVAIAPSAPPRAEVVEPPHFNVAYLNNPRPEYPPMARKLGLEGLVLLRVDVSANGTPEKIVISQTSGTTLLDDAAMRAVQGWTFVPARRGDTPIAHPVEVPIRFKFKN